MKIVTCLAVSMLSLVKIWVGGGQNARGSVEEVHFDAMNVKGGRWLWRQGRLGFAWRKVVRP